MSSQSLQLSKPDSIAVSKRTDDKLSVRAVDREEKITYQLTTHRKTLEGALKHIFPDRLEETRLQRARKIMGEVVKDLSDDELEVYLAEFQFLIESWLDRYEKELFNGLTLQQMLREEGHATTIR